jgi:predicted DNA-binding protein
MAGPGVPGDAVFRHEAIDRAIAGDEIIGAGVSLAEDFDLTVNVLRVVRVGDDIRAEMEHEVINDIRGRTPRGLLEHEAVNEFDRGPGALGHGAERHDQQRGE